MAGEAADVEADFGFLLLEVEVRALVCDLRPRLDGACSASAIESALSVSSEDDTGDSEEGEGGLRAAVGRAMVGLGEEECLPFEWWRTFWDREGVK